MKVLLLGSGGREHALAWKIAQSPKVEKLFIAPGNAGTSAVGENVSIKATDFPALKAFALEQKIDMIVVGPEDPLVEGIYDSFTGDASTQHIAIIGPTAKGAQLEGSKEFAKGFMERHGIPTARYKSITAANLDEGLAFLETLQAPYVLKADGLCAGKRCAHSPYTGRSQAGTGRNARRYVWPGQRHSCYRRIPQRYRVLRICADRQ